MNGVIVREKAVNGLGAQENIAEGAALRANSRLSWLALGVAAAAALGLYAPLLVGMAKEWSEFPSLSHGFAVPVISAYLLWRRRELLAQAPVEASTAGLPLIMLALGMLVIAMTISLKIALPWSGRRSARAMAANARAL